MKKEVNKILDYIEVHISDALSLDLLSEHLFYSKTYLSRVFNKFVGINLNKYINKRRLSLAAIEIMRKQKSISYIANFYGFNSQKYFSNQFKKTFGITPSEYQKGNIFITLQPKRIIKGDGTMIANSVREVCKELSVVVDNENTLLDKIAVFENVEIFSTDNSDVKLIGYFIETDKSYIFEISLNLMNGLFTQKTIFFINNQKHSIESIGKDELGVYVIFEDNNTHKQIRSTFTQGSQPKVIMNTETINDLRIYGKHQTKQGYDQMMSIVGDLKEKIIKQTNYEEVLNLAEKEEDLILLRHFGSEFIFVKLLKDVGYFQMESIYTNMSTKFIESYSFFKSYVDAESIVIKQNGLTLEVYCDGVIYGKSYIYGGDELTSSIFIKFPSGMSGTGGWDFSPEFK